MKDPLKDNVQILKPSDWMNRDRNRRRSMDQDNDTLEEKNATVAVVLSILFTGAGHLYAGKESQGTTLLVIYFALAVLSAVTGGVLLIALFPFWLWGIFDVNYLVEEHNIRVRKATQERQAEQEKAQAEQEKIRKETTDTSEFVEQIEKLSKLHSANFLSEDEYSSQKKDLILSLLDKKPQDDPIDFFTALVPSIEKKYLTEEEISQIKKFVE